MNSLLHQVLRNNTCRPRTVRARSLHTAARLCFEHLSRNESTRQTNYYTSLTGHRATPASAETVKPPEEADPGKEVEVRHDQPHASTEGPPPTHYFDTNKIYTGLRFSGYTEGQSEIIMRAMRDILTHNLEECKEESIPQNVADNEAYLFEAARSELRTEVQKLREMQAAEYSSNLGRLQRDVEIAHQELNESITMMKSGIDIDINDRKNTTNHEASLVHMRLQELNNKISISIVSDLKNEIEALRWQTTRRGLAAVGFVIGALLISISVSKKSEKAHQVSKPTQSPGAEFSVPILTSPEYEINDLEEKRFAVESLNGLAK